MAPEVRIPGYAGGSCSSITNFRTWSSSIVSFLILALPIARAPIATAPIASAPKASDPIANAPTAEAPIDAAPVAHAPVAAAPVAVAPVADTPVSGVPSDIVCALSSGEGNDSVFFLKSFIENDFGKIQRVSCKMKN
jgi:hypothetical protein